MVKALELTIDERKKLAEDTITLLRKFIDAEMRTMNYEHLNTLESAHFICRQLAERIQ